MIDYFEMYEEFLNDYEYGAFSLGYVDTDELEDEYGHIEIKKARQQFILMANKYLDEIHSPYIMRKGLDCARLFDRETDMPIR